MAFLILDLSPPAWTLLGVLIGGLLTGIINYILQRSQFRHNKEMYFLKNQSKEQVKEIVLELLNHRKYTDRTFSALKKRIGGYSDDELRQILHEVGAQKSSRKDGGGEWWYLTERNDERIEKKIARRKGLVSL